MRRGRSRKKKRGKPKEKWLEAATADVRMLGVTNWKKASQDREQWRKILKKSCDDVDNGM
jgi:hypothetical protein